VESTDRSRKLRVATKTTQEKWEFMILINPDGEGLSVADASAKLGIHPATGYRWLNKLYESMPEFKEMMERFNRIDKEERALDRRMKKYEYSLKTRKHHFSYDEIMDEQGGGFTQNGNDPIKRKF